MLRTKCFINEFSLVAADTLEDGKYFLKRYIHVLRLLISSFELNSLSNYQSTILLNRQFVIYSRDSKFQKPEDSQII